MPAITGPIQIINANGIDHFGDTLVISPKTANKTIEGAGADNTGIFVIANSVLSVNNTLDMNAIDQPMLANN